MKGQSAGISRRTLLKSAGALGVVSVAAACAPTAVAPASPSAGATTAVAAIKRGGTFNLGEVGDPISFDPHNRSNASATVLQRMVYQCFTRQNARTLSIEPALATKWDFTTPTEIMWTLREGVVFHNGQPFTAEDAKWNVDRAIDPETASPFASWYDAVARNDVVSRYVLKMTLKRPDPLFPARSPRCACSASRRPTPTLPRLPQTRSGPGPFKVADRVPNDPTYASSVARTTGQGRAVHRHAEREVRSHGGTSHCGAAAGQIDSRSVSADGAKRLAKSTNLKLIKGAHGVFTVIRCTNASSRSRTSRAPWQWTSSSTRRRSSRGT